MKTLDYFAYKVTVTLARDGETPEYRPAYRVTIHELVEDEDGNDHLGPCHGYKEFLGVNALETGMKWGSKIVLALCDMQEELNLVMRKEEGRA